MNAAISVAANLSLTLRRSGDWKDPLYPEQAALFDISFRNQDTAPVTVLDIEANADTPEVVLYSADGKEIACGTPFTVMARAGVAIEHERPGPPTTTDLPPEKARRSRFNLWSYVQSPGPGHYAVEVRHRISSTDPFLLRSNREPFEIVSARIEQVALGYNSYDRSSSVLAWLASDARTPAVSRLLVRLSQETGHSYVQSGANTFAEVASDSHLSVGQPGQGNTRDSRGWIGVASGHTARVFRRSSGVLTWQTEAVLPTEATVEVQSFPDLGERAIFLAAGKHNGGYALSGFAVESGKQAAVPWVVPLGAPPVLCAAAFHNDREIHVVYAAEDGSESRIYRLVVNGAGKLVQQESLIQRSSLEVRALTVVSCPGTIPTILVLQADRQRHDRIALIRIPVDQSPKIFEPHQVPGWPGSPDPVSAAELCVDQGSDAGIYLGMTDEAGDLYAGRLDKGIAKQYDGRQLRALGPHIAALRQNTTAACFVADGSLCIPGGGHAD